jgi:hypothetical protein
MKIIQLDDLAQKVYDGTLPDLPPPVSFTDTLMLATYAQHVSDYERLRLQIESDGDTLPDQNGVAHKHHLSIPMAKSDAMAKATAVLLKIDRKQRMKLAQALKAPAKRRNLRKEPRQSQIV